ncbi:MAG: 3-methyl-2-oxobutanoate hydroxymethyltransferase, partial [Longimicrobiales bacterium]
MSSQRSAGERALTVHDLLDMKTRGDKVVVLTAYDFLFGRLVDEAGVDIVLVGDSLGQVFAGLDSTLPVTLDDMVYHARAVRRAVKRAVLVVDLPFLTFQISPEETLRNAGRVMKEAGAEAIKLEGGDDESARHVRALVRAGIPVMGHVGLTPQSVHALGGYRVQGREQEQAARLRDDARRLQDAGAFAIVLELVPAALAGEITAALDIVTIG